MQKKIRYKPLSLCCMIIAAVTIMTSCADDPAAEEQESTLLQIRLPGMRARGGNLYSDESMITKVRLFLFNGQYLEKILLFNAGEESFHNTFQVKTKQGVKSVYVVVNEETALTTALESVKTISSLESILVEASEAAVAPFMMSGYKKDTDVIDPTTQLSLSLTRLVSKITLTLRKGTETTADIAITGVHLSRAAEKMSLFEDVAPPLIQSYWSHPYTLTSPVVLTTNEVLFDWEGHPALYLHENRGSVADTTGRATYLLINALYNGTPVRYKAYINDENSTADGDKYSIEKNTHYALSATISSPGETDGILLATIVKDWVYIASERGYRCFEISTTASWSVPHREVSYLSGSILFAFSMLHPVGGVWRATLSNGLDFAMDDTFAVTGSSGGTSQVGVKALKPAGTVDRVTEFYLTVDGKEVDTNGDGQTGKGYRYVITQKAAE